MSALMNETDPGHLASDTELQSPTSANAVTRAQAAAHNETTQSEPNILQLQSPSSTATDAEINYDLYHQLTVNEIPTDQQWLQSTEELD